MLISKNTKAEVLKKLKKRARTFLIEDIYSFTVGDWNKDSVDIINRIKQMFQISNIVVRSSALNEDTNDSSMAGYYSSVLNVDASNTAEIERAVNSVIKSYAKIRTMKLHDQVLVQPQTKDVIISGVVLTRDLETNAPYYIINYDDVSGRTDTVTSGISNQKVAIFRFVKEPFKGKWKNLLIAIQEIEEFFNGQPLDIEFAIRKDKEVVILQVRPLVANKRSKECDYRLVGRLIDDMKEKFIRFTKRVPHLCGKTTIYADMTDWNPAEIIGDKPNTLDYTLYRFLITNNIWHEARTSLGYFDVYPGELMTSFGRKPYIDARLSFNSFIPEGISSQTREKLVNYYLNKLAAQPELQDKVEFEILWTCYDFSLERNIRILLKNGFTENEVLSITQELKKLTLNVICHCENIFTSDLEATKILAYRRDQTLLNLDRSDVSLSELLSGIYYILHNCRRFGTHPFSRLARIAFIAKSILISLKQNNIVDDNFYDSLLLSVQTVAKKFTYDFKACKNGKLSWEEFFRRYGHLRSGTYDITSLRYDQRSDLFEFGGLIAEEKPNNPRFTINLRQESLINRALKDVNFGIDTKKLINFIVSALEYRELSKFEFTKSLSDSIELIARAGEKLGISRQDLCHIDFDLLMRFRNPEVSDLEYIKKRLSDSIQRHKKEKRWHENVILPPVIKSPDDFDYAEFYKSHPKFITKKQIRGQIFLVNKKICRYKKEITGKIVLIENADPGYDWIFTKNPLAIVTKYGGVASHMAIRCAEFGLPAVIGCGEVIYSMLLKRKEVIIDCKNRKLDYLFLGLS